MCVALALALALPLALHIPTHTTATRSHCHFVHDSPPPISSGTGPPGPPGAAAGAAAGYSRFEFKHAVFQGVPATELDRRYQWNGPRHMDPRAPPPPPAGAPGHRGGPPAPVAFLRSPGSLKRRRLAGTYATRALAFGFRGVSAEWKGGVKT